MRVTKKTRLLVALFRYCLLFRENRGGKTLPNVISYTWDVAGWDRHCFPLRLRYQPNIVCRNNKSGSDTPNQCRFKDANVVTMY